MYLEEVQESYIVKDVVAVGLQNLTSGEKNPVSDHNGIKMASNT